MRIFSISTEGLKSLRSQELTELKDLSTYNVLIGPNNAGKSALLDSIELLRAVVHSIPVDGIFSCDPPTDRIVFEVGLKLSPHEISTIAKAVGVTEVPDQLFDSFSRWAFLFQIQSASPPWPQGQAALRRWWLLSNDDCCEVGSVEQDEAWASPFYDSVPALILSAAGQPAVPIRDLDHTLGEARQNTRGGPPLAPDIDDNIPPLGGMIKQLPNKIRRLDSVRAPRPSCPMESAGKERVLTPDATNLLPFLQVYFSRAAPTAREEFNRAFHQILPDLYGFLAPMDEYEARLKIAPKPDADAEESYDIRHVGGAARQVLCILALVFSAEEGDILLIEEPELNLHPSAQRKLSSFLLKRARERNLQIVLSTHSTIFARRGLDCRTYLVTLDPEHGTVARLLEEEELGVSRFVLGLQQAYIFGYDCCVLFQGDSEERALPLLIEAVALANGKDSDDLGIWFVNLGGSPQRKAIKQYLKYIHGSYVTPYVILDDDQGVGDFVQRLLREHLLSKKHYHIWKTRTRQGRPKAPGSEFEDNFTDEQLISAANQLAEMEYGETGMPRRLSVQEFRSRLKNGTQKTSQVLENYYVDIFGSRGWRKAALNEILARQLAEKVRDGEKPEHAKELIEVCEEIIEATPSA